jgi:hypothetical protein
MGVLTSQIFLLSGKKINENDDYSDTNEYRFNENVLYNNYQ